MQQFKNFLNQVEALNKRYKTINELTGENFNIFRILKLEASEVRMHSAFIAELLNPNGSHGQKDVFLNLFVESFCFKGALIDTATCKVEIEKHVGFLTNDLSQGGRMDIVVTDKNNHQIIIENKIYASDQFNQLYRYYKHSPDADLIYLTLDGKEPEDSSKNGLEINTHYKCCSYCTDIFNWLERCRKEVATHPIIRESITQYLNLIKYLTNQTLNDTMKEELSTIISSNLESAFIIADNLDNTLKKYIENFNTQLAEIAKKTGLKYSCNINIDFKKNYSGFWFWDSEWAKVNIGFQFHSMDKNMIYGIQTKTNPVTEPIALELRETLSKKANQTVKPTNWWPIQYPMDDVYGNWGNYEAWAAIADGSLKTSIQEKVEFLLSLTKGIKL